MATPTPHPNDGMALLGGGASCARGTPDEGASCPQRRKLLQWSDLLRADGASGGGAASPCGRRGVPWLVDSVD
jgi:hypothetical protein